MQVIAYHLVVEASSFDQERSIVSVVASAVKEVRTTLTSSITSICVMTEVSLRITPRPDRVSLSIQTGLSTESSVFTELLRVIVAVNVELERRMTNKAAWGVDRLEREAVTVGETGTDSPAGSLLFAGAIGGCDDLGDDLVTAV